MQGKCVMNGGFLQGGVRKGQGKVGKVVTEKGCQGWVSISHKERKEK